MKFLLGFCFFFIISINKSTSQNVNPAILQDSRDLPKVDGAFGFLYRTEDGIAHAAKGDTNGAVRGRFTYTDPTGLKVNFNYNAGSGVTPKYNYNEPLSSFEQKRYTQTTNNVNYDSNYNGYNNNDQAQNYHDSSYNNNNQDQTYQDSSYNNNNQAQTYQDNSYNNNNNQAQIYQDNQNNNYQEERRSRPPHLRGNAVNNNY